jgi:aldose 1-epimerase
LSHTVAPVEQDGIPVLELRSPELAARFAPAAGMVGCSLVHGGEELLGPRDDLPAYAQSGKTFGIPLLAPWANRLPADVVAVGDRRIDLARCADRVRRDEHGLPIHGLLAGAPDWEVLSADGGQDAARIRAEIPVELPCFPFPHRLRVDVRLTNATLAVTTSVRPSGDVAVPLAFGWHPYLRLPGVPREAWEVDLPVRRRHVLDARGLPTGDTAGVEPRTGPLGDDTFDDLFGRIVPGGEFVLAGGGRRIAVRFDSGYPFAQVYAPPGSPFICFEPMTAPVAALATGDHLRWVEPGESGAATFTLTVSQPL